jgi:hypothetical protein
MISLLLAGASLAAGACGKIGPQKREAEPPPANNKDLYQVDLTKPEGPMYQMLRAAQDRDIALFKASFAPSVDASKFDEQVFRKFRKKVLTNKVTPVPESVQRVSDTEAIVKLRNNRGRELPIHVQNVDGKWLITKADFSEKGRDRRREKKAQGGGQPT